MKLRTLLLGVAVACLLLSHAEAQEPSGYEGFGVDTLSEATLSEFAPSPIDPELRQQIERSLDIRAPGGGVLSPDATTMFFNWNVTGTSQIWRVDDATGFPKQLTGGQDRASLLDVTPDGRHIIISRDTAGDEQYGIYLQPVDGGPLVRVIHDPDVRSSYEFVSDDSKHLYYRANDAAPDTYTIYLYDIATGKREVVFSREGLWNIADYQSDDRLLLELLKGNLYSEFYEWSPATETLTPLMGQDEMDEYNVAYGSREGEFIVLTNKLSEYRRLYRYHDGQFTLVSPELNHDVAYFDIDRQRKRITFGVNRDGYYRAHAMDARTFEELSVPEFPDATHVIFGDTSRDARHSTIHVETEQAPRSSYSYDWKTQELKQWVVSSAPEIDTSRFVAAELEYYTARDGTQIPMFVWRRHSSQNASQPVIVNFHGGPESQARPGFDPTIQLFLQAGFTYVKPNVRGSDGYGKKWLHADNGPRRQQVITDIADCARHIKMSWARQGVAPKVGIYGGSYGGYSTLVGMTIFAGEYDAGVAVVGMSNLVTFLENTAPYRRLLRMTEYGDPDRDHDALLELSPITHVEKVRDPLLILHGATDPRVPVGEAVQFYEKVRDRDVTANLILFPDEGHGVRKRSNRVLSLGHTIGFFQKHLK